MGVLLALFSAIEFQKRGLPHAHILLILGNKISPDDYDNYVSAKVPCPTTQDPLHNLVVGHMILPRADALKVNVKRGFPRHILLRQQ